MQAAIYCRISQDRNGSALGVKRQERLCRELVDRLGWDVAEVYTDNDTSAYNGHARPAYERMLDAARSGIIDAIVVLDTDRLTRHPRELEDVIDLAESHRVALANVSGKIDLGSSEGRLIARITGAVARQESERKSERTRRKQDELALAGAWAGGPRRFGYTDGMAAIIEPEAEAIRQAARAVLDQDASWRSLAAAWNAVGLTSPRGGEWRPGSVRRTLISPFLAGLRVHRGEVVGRAQWPAILDRVTHQRLAAITRSGRPRSYATRLLTGILVCGRCGHGLTASQTDKSRRIYRCKPEPGDSSRCGNLNVSAEPAEAAVRAMVLDALAGPGLDAAAAAVDDAETADALARLEELSARKAEAARMFADGLIGRSEYLPMRDRIETQVAEVSETIAAPQPADGLIDRLRNTDDLPALWDGSDDRWRRQVLGLLIESIVVAPVGPRRQRFDPARLAPVWRA